jgi:glucose uptake protein GlcU
MQIILGFFALVYLWVQFVTTAEEAQREASEVEEYDRQWRAKHNLPKLD